MKRNSKINSKKVLILTSLWGHESIAKGIKDGLINDGYQVRLEVIEMGELWDNAYNAIYRFIPKAYVGFYRLSNKEIFAQAFKKVSQGLYSDTISRLVSTFKPKIIFCCNPGFNSSLSKINKDNQYKIFNIISDPWTFTKMYFEKNFINIVFDERSLNLAKNYASTDTIHALGWFVEDKFYTNKNKTIARQSLKLNPDILTLCFTGGSAGMFDVLKSLVTLSKTKNKVQVLFMCGNNKSLYDVVYKLSKLMNVNKNLKIIPFKYFPDMDIIMKASDIVIGKAGPNTIFEAVATHTPFLATSHISGQEDGNLELIKKYQIGYVEDKLPKIASIIKRIIKTPTILNQFNPGLKKLASYNHNSKRKLLSLINDKISE